MQYDGDDKGGDVGIPKYVLYDGVDTLDEAYDAPEDKEEQGEYDPQAECSERGVVGLCAVLECLVDDGFEL